MTNYDDLTPEERIHLELTPEERQRIQAFVTEATAKAQEVKKLFGSGTRGMMMFAFAMHTLQIAHPVLFDNADIAERMAEWFAAGAPEDLRNIADKIIARCTKGKPN